MVSPRPPAESLELEQPIVAAIRRLMRAVGLHSRRLVEDYGLTGPQLATLRAADRLGAAPASALARVVQISGATMTGILTRLEKRDLVVRARGERDRRTVTVTVTELGRDVLARAPSLLQDRFRRELSRLQRWEQLMMLASLERIAAMMGAEGLDAAPYLVGGDGLLEPESRAAAAAGESERPEGSPGALPPDAP